MEGSAPMKIVLLGKTGSGKSSLGNTIFGGDVFSVDHGFNSETKKCETQTKPVDGCNISLIDSPGLFDTSMSEDELKSEIVKCIVECSPGVHAFLIVLKWEKYTKQEQDVINKISSYFSDEVLKYSVVVFTHGDQLPAGRKIEEVVGEVKAVKDLVEKCGGRCHVVDNRRWDEDSGDEYRTNQFQVKELLSTINRMVTDNKGKNYTNEMLEAVGRKIQEEEEKLEKNPKPSILKRFKAKAKRVVKKILKYTVAVTTGALFGALLGLRKAVGEGHLTNVPALIMYALQGAIEGGASGLAAAAEAESIGEAAKNAIASVSRSGQLKGGKD